MPTWVLLAQLVIHQTVHIHSDFPIISNNA